MRKVAVSFAAVLMVLASFAAPSFAGHPSTVTYEGQNFTVSYSIPDTVQAGGTLTAHISILVNSDPTSTSATRMVAWRIDVPGLRASRSNFREFPTDKTKNITKSFPIPDRITPGQYTAAFQIQVGTESKTFVTPFTITEK
jgi:hypothetical protein